MFSGKKFFLIGIIVILLIAIPVTFYLVSQQLKPKQSAPVPSTTLSFSPNTQSATVGQDLNFDVTVNPETNSVSEVKLTILYDSTKLATQGAGFAPNKSIFPLVVSGPDFSPGMITATVAVAANSSPVSKSTSVGTLYFTALDATNNVPTQVSYGQQTQTLANTATGATNENLLATTIPANVNISGTANVTPTIAPQDISPTPDTKQASSSVANPSPTPEIIAYQQAGVTDTPTPTFTPTPTADTTSNSATGPTCTSFTADSTNGTAPFSVNFTLAGTSTADIQKATFYFGDGQSQDITAASGAISGTTANVLASHTYSQGGTFTAYGTVTDVNGNVSPVSNNCSLPIDVAVAASGSASAVPTLAPTGPSGIVTLGLMGVLITILGAVLFAVI